MWDWIEVVHAVGALLIFVLLLLVGWAIYALTTRYDLNEQLTEADNPAVGTALFGYLAGLALPLLAIIATPGHEADTWLGIAIDLGELAIYGLISIGLLHLSGIINDRVILHSFKNRKELVNDRNIGAGAVVAGTYVATGLVLAGAAGGQITEGYLPDPSVLARLMHGLAATFAFFGLGQVVLVLYARLYMRVSRHDPLDAIERDITFEDGRRAGGNAAAGMALAGHLVALGVVLWGALAGDFFGWIWNGGRFLWMAGLGLMLLPLWRIFVDRVLLSRADLAKEIYEDHNVNAALLEGVSLVGFACALVLVLWPTPVAHAGTRCIAHRGNNAAELENSWASVRSAREVGAHGIEFDVVHTQDGVGLLMHDKTLERVAQGEACPLTTPIHELTADTIFSRCTLQNGEAIPLLSDVLSEASSWDQTLFVELKDVPSDATVALLSSTHKAMGERLKVISFDKKALDRVVGIAELDTIILRVLVLRASMRRKGANGPYAGWDVYYRSGRKAMIRRAEKHGVDLAVWTVNAPERMRKLAERGVPWLTVDDPVACLDALETP